MNWMINEKLQIIRSHRKICAERINSEQFNKLTSEF